MIFLVVDEPMVAFILMRVVGSNDLLFTFPGVVIGAYTQTIHVVTYMLDSPLQSMRRTS